MEYTLQPSLSSHVLGLWKIGLPRYLPIHHLLFWLIWGVATYLLQAYLPLYRGDFIIAGVGIFILAQLYRWLDLSSIDIFADQYGVWVKQGFLPWKAGITGIKWRDLEAVDFNRSVYAWVTRCYDLRLQERFTEKSPVIVRGVYRGDQAATLINTHLMKQVALPPVA